MISRFVAEVMLKKQCRSVDVNGHDDHRDLYDDDGSNGGAILVTTTALASSRRQLGFASECYAMPLSSPATIAASTAKQ